jgi:hypothetical protein
MRFLIKISLFIFIVALLSCQKETTKLSGCDVNGLWLGTWSSPGNANGTFFAPVTQSNINITGNVFIRFDLPSLENDGVEFTAQVTDKNVKSMIDFSGVTVKVNGKVDNDTSVSGNFEVSTGMSGVFNGTKIQTEIPVTNEIFSSSASLTGLVCVGQLLWVWTGNGIYADDKYGYVVKRLNFNGNLVDTLILPGEGYSYENKISFDGKKFWALHSGSSTIYTFDTLGNRIDTFNSSVAIRGDAIACTGNQVYVTDGYNRVTHILNSTTQELSTIPNNYISIGALCKYKDNLYMGTTFYNTILKTDMNGNIIKAFILPGEVVSITTNSTAIWCLTQKYINKTTGPGSTQYKILKIELN